MKWKRKTLETDRIVCVWKMIYKNLSAKCSVESHFEAMILTISASTVEAWQCMGMCVIRGNGSVDTIIKGLITILFNGFQQLVALIGLSK